MFRLRAARRISALPAEGRSGYQLFRLRAGKDISYPFAKFSSGKSADLDEGREWTSLSAVQFSSGGGQKPTVHSCSLGHAIRK